MLEDSEQENKKYDYQVVNIIEYTHTRELGKKITPAIYMITYMNEYIIKKAERNIIDIYDYIHD